MRLITHLIFALAFRRYWKRHFADQYAVLIAGVGLTRAEEQTFLALRRAR
jgi:hypothetical protein